MERRKNDVVISLSGIWEKEPEWRGKFKFLLLEMVKQSCEDVFDFQFLESAAINKVPFLPELPAGLLSAASFSQQMFQASRAHLTILMNDGLWDESKYKMLDVLEQQSSVLIVWTPAGVADVHPEMAAEVPDFSSLLIGQGSLERLVALVLYIVLPKQGILLDGE
jgi:hypothetical protein